MDIAGLSFAALVWCWLTVLAAAVVRGYAGFGFSALVVATHGLLLPPAQVLPAVFMMEIIASLHMLPAIWRQINWRLLITISAGAAVAMPAGLWALAHWEAATVRFLIYGTIAACALLLLAGWRLHNAGTKSVFAAGIVSGGINGIAGIGGLPAVAFVMATSLGVAASRATLIAYLFIGDVYALAWVGGLNLAGSDIMLRVLIFLPALAGGVWLGNRHFLTAPPQQFKKHVLWLLLVLCAAGLLKGVVG